MGAAVFIAGLSRGHGGRSQLRLGQPPDADAPDPGDLRAGVGDLAARSRHAAPPLYDICHNIAKIETLPVEGKEMKLCVHRKGATRAYPPGHPLVPPAYRKVGQPVLIPGDMGTGSYVLAGTQGAFTETFGSTCHGAGRVMSRTQATKSCRGRSIPRELAARGVVVMSSGKGTLMEEIPEAYKNLDEVVEVVHQAGFSRKVARLRAIGCVNPKNSVRPNGADRWWVKDPSR